MVSARWNRQKYMIKIGPSNTRTAIILPVRLSNSLKWYQIDYSSNFTKSKWDNFVPNFVLK